MSCSENYICSAEPAEPIRCGIDFGGVITHMIRGIEFGAGDLHAKTGAFDSIRELVEVCNGDVWIVSKAGKQMQAKTRDWLDQTDFYAITGLDPERIEFCKSRQGKRPICERLGLTHFLDDRLHLMFILRSVVPNLYLFEGAERYQQVPAWVTATTGWIDFLASIRKERLDQVINSSLVYG